MKKQLVLFCNVILLASCFMFVRCSDGDTIYEDVDAKPNYANVAMELPELADANWIDVIFTPNSITSRFVYAVGSESDRNNFLSGNLTTTEVEGNEEVTRRISDLEPGREYMIFARAYDSAGEAGPVSSIYFTTFEGDLETAVKFIGPISMAIDFTPSIAYKTVEYALVTSLDEIENFNKEIEYDEDGLYDPAEYANKIVVNDAFRTFTGTFFDLDPETEYYLLYRAQDRYLNWTKTFVGEYSTVSKESVPHVEVVINYNDFWIANFDFVKNDLVSNYYVGVSDPDVYNGFYLAMGMYAGDYLSFMNAYRDSFNPFNDSVNINWPSYTREPEYMWEVLVLVTDINNEPSSVVRVRYETPKYESGLPEAEVEILDIEVTTEKITYKLKPNDATMGYYIETFAPDAISDYELENDIDFITFFDMNYSFNNINWSHRYAYNGELWSNEWVDEYDIEEFGDMDMVVAVAAMNKNGTWGWGKVTRQTFRTPAKP